MPLSDYKPPTEKIEFPGGSFEVRGISLMDVAIIVETHQNVVESIYQKLQGRNIDLENLDAESVGGVVTDLIRESPSLVGHVIAIVTDEDDVPITTAAKLPVSIQIEALQAIGRLTFTDFASVKKFGADVLHLIRSVLPPQAKTSARKRAA